MTDTRKSICHETGPVRNPFAEVFHHSSEGTAGIGTFQVRVKFFPSLTLAWAVAWYWMCYKPRLMSKERDPAGTQRNNNALATSKRRCYVKTCLVGRTILIRMRTHWVGAANTIKLGNPQIFRILLLHQYCDSYDATAMLPLCRVAAGGSFIM